MWYISAERSGCFTNSCRVLWYLKMKTATVKWQAYIAVQGSAVTELKRDSILSFLAENLLFLAINSCLQFSLSHFLLCIRKGKKCSLLHSTFNHHHLYLMQHLLLFGFNLYFFVIPFLHYPCLGPHSFGATDLLCLELYTNT